MAESDFLTLRDALRTIRDLLPRLNAEIAGSSTVAPSANEIPWLDKLVRVVLPSLDFDLPVLMTAICGGGSTGKSTLFNALAGSNLSRVGFKAGLTTRVLLAGHPDILSGPGVAQALLYRLRETPQPWQTPDDALTAGPPLYAASVSVPRNLLLLDTPDFDTGAAGRLQNREKAEPVLRSADVILYVFTNTVYNNLSNTLFMADIVGGIGGRPVVLVYRISRAASDEEVSEHCRVVANKLFQRPVDAPGYPELIIGIYRMPESDAVALGQEAPHIIPLGRMTGGQELRSLLANLDVSRLKRQIFAADLRSIRQDTGAQLAQLARQAEMTALYRQALQHTLTEQALQALKTFPLNEAAGLAARLFMETGPAYIKIMRGTGRVVGAPIRGLQWLGHRISRVGAPLEKSAQESDPEAALSQDLLLSANTLRNRLMDDHLIIRVTRKDALYAATEAILKGAPLDEAPVIEPSGSGTVNLHIPVPQAIQNQDQVLLKQDWEATTTELRQTAHELMGLPSDIEDELKALVIEFRAQMSWQDRLRETLFASLSALPPLLGITYTVLTANPVSGVGIWIKLQSLFGINDLWALVAIPASAGLSSQERKQLELTISPVFQIWLQHRMSSVVNIFQHTVCSPIIETLEGIPSVKDPRFSQVAQAIRTLGDKYDK